jgi:hypothetical protein
MIIGKIGELVYDGFSVTNDNNDLVVNIDSTAFTYHLFDPDNNEVNLSSNTYTINMGYGHYKTYFTPNKIGNWVLIVYHSTYFPAGKSGTFQIFSNDFDTIAINLTRALGLMQENYYLDNTIYGEFQNLISCRIRVYSDNISVGTNNNIIATYLMESEWDNNIMKQYRMVKQ